MKKTFKKIFQHLTVATVVFWSIFAVVVGVQQLPKEYNVDLHTVSDQTVTDIIHVLYEARAQDSVIIHVASYGGSIKTMFQLLGAIKHSKAHVTTISEGMSVSAGSATSLAGDTVIIRDPTIFMFHVARYQSFFGVRLVPLYDPQQELTSEVVAKYAAPYMSKDEIDRYIAGKDVWVKGSVIQDRINAGIKKENTGYFIAAYAYAKQKQLAAHALGRKLFAQDLAKVLETGTKKDVVAFLNERLPDVYSALPSTTRGMIVRYMSKKTTLASLLKTLRKIDV